MSKEFAFAYAVLGLVGAPNARRRQPSANRCLSKTTALLAELGPPKEMDLAERRVLNTLIKGCRACGKCPEMQGIGVMTRAP